MEMMEIEMATRLIDESNVQRGASVPLTDR